MKFKRQNYIKDLKDPGTIFESLDVIEFKDMETLLGFLKTYGDLELETKVFKVTLQSEVEIKLFLSLRKEIRGFPVTFIKYLGDTSSLELQAEQGVVYNFNPGQVKSLPTSIDFKNTLNCIKYNVTLENMGNMNEDIFGAWGKSKSFQYIDLSVDWESFQGMKVEELPLFRFFFERLGTNLKSMGRDSGSEIMLLYIGDKSVYLSGSNVYLSDSEETLLFDYSRVEIPNVNDLWVPITCYFPETWGRLRGLINVEQNFNISRDYNKTPELLRLVGGYLE